MQDASTAGRFEDPSSSVSLPGRAALMLLIFWVLFHIFKAIYNISPLHPLSHIPGPKLAAATYWPEFYHDVIKVGRYSTEIRKMHQEYGPIVRISPGEVHCNDSKFSNEIYAVGGRKRDKPIHQVNATVIRQASFGTTGHDLHRLRRGPMSKFFSRSMIARLEPDVAALTQRMCDKILLRQGQREPLDVAVAYSNLTTDVISGYCFGEAFGLLDQDGWYPNFRDPTMATLKPMFAFRFFPILKSLTKIGEYFVDYMPPDVALLIRTMSIDIPNRTRKTAADRNAGIVYPRPTIVGAILDSDISAEEKQPMRVAEDALAVVGAGTETTSWALAVITFHLLTKPDLLDRLTTEVREVVPDPKHLPSWTVLEKLPFLNACIQEGLRLSYGVSGRSARIPTEESLHYKGEFNKKPVDLVLPKGYAVGMSSVISNHDELIYPESNSFIPDRWIVNEQERKDLDRASLAFGRGSRSCLGMNLALCELHLALAALALRVFPRMKLYETTEDDIRYDYDMLIPIPKDGTHGVRATIL